MMGSMIQWLYLWLIAVPFLGISTFLIGVPLTVLSFFGLGDWCSRTLAALGSLKCVHAGCVSIDGLHHLDDGQSYVLTANHLSQVDILLIYGFLPVDFKWVLKKELLLFQLSEPRVQQWAMWWLIAQIRKLQSPASRRFQNDCGTACASCFSRGTRGTGR